MSGSDRGYGWRRQQPDHRDRLFHLEEQVSRGQRLPATGGISADRMPPIWDQGRLGSCTAHGSLRAFLTCAIAEGVSVPMLSRLMQYWDTRSLEGTTGSDAGGTVRDAVKALATFGCAPESDWPYDVSQFAVEPPARARADAANYMAIKYQSIVVGGPGAPIRTALQRGLAVVFGFSVPQSFEDGSWDPASGQPLPLPGPDEGFIGGHCVCVRAYDFSGPTPYFTAQNSWGEGWGMNGEFNMDARWFTPQYRLATDLWVISKDT